MMPTKEEKEYLRKCLSEAVPQAPASFFVDFCFEAGSEEYGSNVSGWYGFKMELSDKDYEELFKIWYDQNEMIC